MLTLITPTGGRPEAFALCELWMSRQSYRGDLQWIVVDDGRQPTRTTMGQTVIRPEPLWPHYSASKTTQHRNILAALPIVSGEFIAMIEDDDWYGPEHLSNVVAALESHAAVGEIPSRYYHVGRQAFKEFDNTEHASLCQTGFRSDLIPAIQEICQKPASWIDMELWARVPKDGLYFSSQVIGIKGMPGRDGISRAHRLGGAGWRSDAGIARLRQWIGADAAPYTKYALVTA